MSTHDDIRAAADRLESALDPAHRGGWSRLVGEEISDLRATIAAARMLEQIRQRLRELAAWHETKADKARRYPGLFDQIAMNKAATVHEDAARRILAALDGEHE